MDQILEHIVEKSRQARDGSFDCLSTSEQIAAALALNRADWLARIGCTLAGAIWRLDAAWLSRIPDAEQLLNND